MPNHVHVLIATNAETDSARSCMPWKRFTTRRINALLGRTGPVWAKDYFDRYVRDDRHFETTKAYIENNPVVAGLCDTPGAWLFSSAGWRSA